MGGGYSCVPLTRAENGVGGGREPPWEPLGVRGHLICTMMCYDAAAPLALNRFVLINEKVITRFIKMRFDADTGANIVI